MDDDERKGIREVIKVATPGIARGYRVLRKLSTIPRKKSLRFEGIERDEELNNSTVRSRDAQVASRSIKRAGGIL